MSDRVERILDLLEGHEAQSSTEWGDRLAPEGQCWRCETRPAEGPAGVCPSCRAILLDEAYEAPVPRWSDELERRTAYFHVSIPPELQEDIADAERLFDDLFARMARQLAEAFQELAPTIRLSRVFWARARAPLPPIPAKAAHRRRYTR